MTLVFHQNMRDFAGTAAWRNANFGLAFTGINGVTGADYIVAGFTEILDNDAAEPALAALAAQLDPTLTRLAVIQVGITAVGKQREFAGIAWDPASVNAQYYGFTYWSAADKAWRASVNAMPAAATFRRVIPDEVQLGADTRGAAYIAGISGGFPWIFGFLHDMYNIRDRGLLLQSLSSSVKRIREKIGGPYGDSSAIFGGDFNVKADVRTFDRPVPVRVAAAQTAAGPPIVWTDTTAANPFDWWVVTDNLGWTHANCSVYTETRTFSMGMTARPRDGANIAPSDHGGITIGG